MSWRDRWDQQLGILQEKHGPRRIRMLASLAIAGVASIVIQLLVWFEFQHSALLYIAVPYSVAVLITLMRPYQAPDRWWQRYTSHALSALVVFLGSSAVLLEGFICVLFFMPIYFLIVTIAFVAGWIEERLESRKSRTYSTAIPLIIAILSIEGTSDVVTFDRHSTATASMMTTLSPDAVLKNLATPFELPSSQNWMLGLFPMPVAIDAGSLSEGDIHTVHMRYHRWFFTNTHEGVIELRIESVTPERVTVNFIRDTSYFSTYVKLVSSEITLAVDDSNLTQVSLTLSYERRLDPAWYFRPIQQYAMETMAQHLISEVMIGE